LPCLFNMKKYRGLIVVGQHQRFVNGYGKTLLNVTRGAPITKTEIDLEYTWETLPNKISDQFKADSRGI
jgi:hypothetical protein